MNHLTRRSVLLGSVAALAAPALPAQAAWVRHWDLANIPDKTVAWTVGTDGDYNWQFIRADNPLDAIKAWVHEHAGSFACDDGGEPGEAGKEECDCEPCEAFRNADARRMTQWDHFVKTEPTPADWLRVGMGYICERCGEETSTDGGAKIVTLTVADQKRDSRFRHTRLGENVLCEECHDKLERDKFDAEQARLADAEPDALARQESHVEAAPRTHGADAYDPATALSQYLPETIG